MTEALYEDAILEATTYNDGEAENPETALALTDDERRLAAVGGERVAGTLALAVLSDEQFEARLKAMIVGRQRIRLTRPALKAAPEAHEREPQPST